jgi:drug/metabolite transporter (DMT)-like permease
MGRIPLCFLFLSFDGGDPMVPGRSVDSPVILSQEFYYLGLCAATGIAGQFLLTNGFRYVTAVDGSIISSMRILLAALLGPYVAGDPALNSVGWAGALLLFGANAMLAVRRSLKE